MLDDACDFSQRAFVFHSFFSPSSLVNLPAVFSHRLSFPLGLGFCYCIRSRRRELIVASQNVASSPTNMLDFVASHSLDLILPLGMSRHL